jgi:ATP-dependent protease ClpP protease subunit
MRHFNIKSEADSTEIDIFGQIGESFFDEGNTLDTVKSEISGITTPITFNVSSLGGDAFEGLAIHDLIAAHKHKTTVNIVGATASAGAVISMAGDEVNISENSLFLIHNSLTFAFGNVKDLEKHIDAMNQIDSRMTTIFVNKTGMDEKAVKSLMEEDRFMDADEALEKGFVDAISKPVKIAASVDMEKVLASKLSQGLKDQLINSNQTEKMELSEDSKSWFQSAIDAAITAVKGEETKEVKVTLADADEVKAKISEFEKGALAAKTENEALTAKVAELEAKVALSNAPEITTETKTDPNPVETVEEVNAWASTAAEIHASLPKGLV